MAFQNKYSAVKTNYDGRTFASKLEASVYQLIKLRERAGEFKLVRCQENVKLSRAGILYIPDFTCEFPSGELIYIEAKGFEAARWPTIKKLWKAYGPGVLEIWKGTYARLHLADTIVPARKVCPVCQD